MNSPKFSIIVPIYNMDNAQFFLKRNLDSILAQTYKDYEIVIADGSEDDQLEIFLYQYPVQYYKSPARSMATNTNFAIDKAKGEKIKILFQDDFFYDENALADIDKYFVGQAQWFVTGCKHTTGYGQIDNEHYPFYSESENTIGSPSVLAFRRTVEERFDPQFHWVLDLDLYKRLYHNYGKPKILNKVNVVIGLHPGQKTHLLSDERKIMEHQLLRQKYDTSIKA